MARAKIWPKASNENTLAAPGIVTYPVNKVQLSGFWTTGVRQIPSSDDTRLTLTLKMNSAEVVFSELRAHRDDHIRQTSDTPGFKQFTMMHTIRN